MKATTSLLAASLAALALLPAGLAACSHGAVVPGGAAVPDGTAPAARPPDCPLEFLHKPPDRPFEPLGEKQNHVMAVPPGGALETLRPWACALGADAVVVRRNQVLNILDHVMVEGTAIRYRPAPVAPPPPEVPPAVAPEPQPSAQ